MSSAEEDVEASVEDEDEDDDDDDDDEEEDEESLLFFFLVVAARVGGSLEILLSEACEAWMAFNRPALLTSCRRAPMFCVGVEEKIIY